MAKIAPLVLAVVVAGGCNQPWPVLPPTTYAGVVIDRATGDPMEDVDVVAWRPRVRGISVLQGYERLGTTRTDAAGAFYLETAHGYATRIEARSNDGRYVGWAKTQGDSSEQVAVLLTTPVSVAFHGDVPNRLPADSLAAAERLVAWMAAHPHEPRQSLAGYRNAGVLMPWDFGAIASYSDLFLGRSPKIHFAWGSYYLVFPSVDEPIELLPAF